MVTASSSYIYLHSAPTIWKFCPKTVSHSIAICIIFLSSLKVGMKITWNRNQLQGSFVLHLPLLKSCHVGACHLTLLKYNCVCAHASKLSDTLKWVSKQFQAHNIKFNVLMHTLSPILTDLTLPITKPHAFCESENAWRASNTIQMMQWWRRLSRWTWPRTFYCKTIWLECFGDVLQFYFYGPNGEFKLNRVRAEV